MNRAARIFRSALGLGALILALMGLDFSALWARPDFDVHPRNLEARIDGRWPQRDTLWVDNYEGDEELVWSFEIVVDDESWITVTPNEGRVAPRREMRVISVQHGPDLEPGHYFADIVFTTNDPTRQEFIVPVAGHTTEYSRITTGWPQPGWGEWWGIIMNNFIQNITWGGAYSFNLRINNPGSAQLVVDSLVTSDGHWILVPSRFNIAAGGFQVVRFNFNAIDVGANSTTITSLSNAWNPRELYFRVTADVTPSFRRGAAIPDMTINEDIADTLVADLDSIFISSYQGLAYQVTAPGLITRIERNEEFFLRPRRDWNGVSNVIVSLTREDSTLADTFRVTVNPLPDAPGAFDLISPTDWDTLRWDGDDSLFLWQASRDPDGDPIFYTFFMYIEGLEGEWRWDISDTCLTMDILNEFDDELQLGGGLITWTVVASDGELTRPAYSTFHHWVVPLSVGDEAVIPPLEWGLTKVYPNPFNSVLSIDFKTDVLALIEIEAIDLTGRKVDILANAVYAPGKYQIVWDAKGLNSGIYLLRMHRGNRIALWKVAVLK